MRDWCRGIGIAMTTRRAEAGPGGPVAAFPRTRDHLQHRGGTRRSRRGLTEATYKGATITWASVL